MTNAFGEWLDRNGYAPSIVPWPHDSCVICNRRDRPLQRHEVFHGSLYRERSKQLGCWVYLCDECHRRLHSTDSRLDKHLKKIVQLEAMHKYRWSVDDFRKHFGKNYVEEV